MPDRAGGPQGLGTPSGDQPGFTPPSAPAGVPVPPGPPAAPPTGQSGDAAQRPWAPPVPDTRFTTPPTGRGPAPARRTRVRVVAAVLAAALVVTGFAILFTPRPTVAPSSATSPGQPSEPVPSVVTVTPSAQPTDATTATSGGSLGEAVDFDSGAGAGTITVHTAVWSDAGEMAAPSGQRYLTLDVTVAARTGEVPVEAILFLAETADGPVLPGFGPQLKQPLGGRLLRSGDQARGQLGYVLEPGPVTVLVLDEQLRQLAELQIPAP